MTIIDAKLVGGYLEGFAKKNLTTNYQAVANHFGLPDFDGAWSSHPLSDLFEILDQEDARLSRPFRTSVVILKGKNIPGNGFFEALDRLKGIPANTPVAKESVFNNEIKSAFAYSW